MNHLRSIVSASVQRRIGQRLLHGHKQVELLFLVRTVLADELHDLFAVLRNQR